MVIIRECDESGNVAVPNTTEERKALWKQCMESCKDRMSSVHFNQIIYEVYGDLYESFSDTDSDSGSSGSVEVLTKMGGSFIDAEVLKYKKSSVTREDIRKLRAKRDISSTGHEEDVVLELCDEEEIVCLFRPKGVENEFFYFYLSLLDDFRIQLPFTDFEVELLSALNASAVQIQPNGWSFIKAFEFICDALLIDPTLGIFFSLFESKGADKGSWISINGSPGKNFLQAFTSNYKNFKNRFVRIKGGEKCMEVLCPSDGRRFPLYWTKDPVPIVGYDYDKLSAEEVQALSFLDSFSLMKTKDIMEKSNDSVTLLSFLAKMTSANIKEHQKLMAEVKVKRAATQSTLQSDPSGFLTQIVRKKRPEADRVAATIAGSEASSSSVPPPVKKQKLLIKMDSSIDHN